MTALALIVETTQAELELVVDAVRKDSTRRQRAATRASGELEEAVEAGDVTDPRSHSVRIVKLLQEAATLERFAEKATGAGVPIGDLEAHLDQGPVARLATPKVPLRARELLARVVPLERQNGAEPAPETTVVEQDDDPPTPIEIERDDDTEPVDAIELSLTPEERAAADA